MFEIAMLTGFLFAAFSQLLPAGPHAPPAKLVHGSATGRGHGNSAVGETVQQKSVA